MGTISEEAFSYHSHTGRNASINVAHYTMHTLSKIDFLFKIKTLEQNHFGSAKVCQCVHLNDQYIAYLINC